MDGINKKMKRRACLLSKTLFPGGEEGDEFFPILSAGEPALAQIHETPTPKASKVTSITPDLNTTAPLYYIGGVRRSLDLI